MARTAGRALLHVALVRAAVCVRGAACLGLCARAGEHGEEEEEEGAACERSQDDRRGGRGEAVPREDGVHLVCERHGRCFQGRLYLVGML